MSLIRDSLILIFSLAQKIHLLLSSPQRDCKLFNRKGPSIRIIWLPHFVYKWVKIIFLKLSKIKLKWGSRLRITNFNFHKYWVVVWASYRINPRSIFVYSLKYLLYEQKNSNPLWSNNVSSPIVPPSRAHRERFNINQTRCLNFKFEEICKSIKPSWKTPNVTPTQGEIHIPFPWIHYYPGNTIEQKSSPKKVSCPHRVHTHS